MWWRVIVRGMVTRHQPLAPRRIEYVPLEQVPPAFRNPKGHSLGELVSSIKEHGFADAAILDERTQRLVAGHGRTQALVWMREHGEPLPDGIAVGEDGGWLVPIQRGWASKSDTHAEAFLILHNQLTVAGGIADERMLAQMLHDIHSEDASLFDGLGFTADELDEIFRRNDPEGLDAPEDPWAEPTGDGVEDTRRRQIVTCPNCYHEFIPGED